MEPKYPKDNEIVVIEYQDDWLVKSTLLFAVRFNDKWIELQSQRPVRENRRCRVMRWWRVGTDNSYPLLPCAFSNGVDPVCGY